MFSISRRRPADLPSVPSGHLSESSFLSSVSGRRGVPEQFVGTVEYFRGAFAFELVSGRSEQALR
jgi:hypothetical protein